jgi:serine protease AprX
VGPYHRIPTTTVNGYTPSFGGTSGATPVNAGAVAIVHQMVAEGHFGPHPAGRASPAAAKALLIAGAHTYAPSHVDHPT